MTDRIDSGEQIRGWDFVDSLLAIKSKADARQELQDDARHAVGHCDIASWTRWLWVKKGEVCDLCPLLKKSGHDSHQDLGTCQACKLHIPMYYERIKWIETVQRSFYDPMLIYLVDSADTKVEAIQAQGARQSLAPGTGCHSRIYLNEHEWTLLPDALEDFFVYLAVNLSTYQLCRSGESPSQSRGVLPCSFLVDQLRAHPDKTMILLTTVSKARLCSVGRWISSGCKTSETVRPLANEWQGKSRWMCGPNRKNLEGNIDNSNVNAKLIETFFKFNTHLKQSWRPEFDGPIWPTSTASARSAAPASAQWQTPPPRPILGQGEVGKPQSRTGKPLGLGISILIANKNPTVETIFIF